MSDPLGLIGAASGGPVRPVQPTPAQASPGAKPGDGPRFRDVFMDTLRQADMLQEDAARAAEDFSTGRRTDLEGVILAVEQAETAFEMIQSLRNKVMQAFEEVKQMRV